MTLTVQQMLAAAEAVVPRISADEAKGLVGRSIGFRSGLYAGRKIR
ncbi:MAG: hypothetical protein INF74_00285 [Roseomonas sp.]|jgi:hypothetical protein|nr:hypothetical protein [Roseomonas sp.]